MGEWEKSMDRKRIEDMDEWLAWKQRIIALFKVDANTTTQVSGIILSLGSVIAYIVGEGLVGAAAAGADSNVTVNGITAGQIATTPDSTPVVGTVGTDAADTASTGAAQAAAVKQDTAESSK